MKKFFGHHKINPLSPRAKVPPGVNCGSEAMYDSLSRMSGIQEDLHGYHQVPEKGVNGERIKKATHETKSIKKGNQRKDMEICIYIYKYIDV